MNFDNIDDEKVQKWLTMMTMMYVAERDLTEYIIYPERCNDLVNKLFDKDDPMFEDFRNFVASKVDEAIQHKIVKKENDFEL